MNAPAASKLASSDAATRARACAELAHDPNAALYSPKLSGLLGDPDPRVCIAAADALARIAARDPGIPQLLRQALRGRVPNARWAAAFASGAIAPPHAGLFPALVEALDQPAGDVRWRALRLLAHCALTLPEVAPLLVGLATDDPRARVREMAVHGLLRIESDPTSLERVLAGAERDPDPRVRRAVQTARAGAPTAARGNQKSR